MKRGRRHLTVRLLTCVVAVSMWAVPPMASATPAGTASNSSVQVEPTTVTAGEFHDVAFVVTNPGAIAVTSVKITFPDDHLAKVDLPTLEGWSPTLALGADDFAESATWTRGSLIGTQRFTVSASFPGDRDRLVFPVQLTYADGRTETIAGSDAVPTVVVSGAVTTTTAAVTTSTSTTVTSAGDEAPTSSSGAPIGLWLITFGVIVIVLLVMRGKALQKREEMAEKRRYR